MTEEGFCRCLNEACGVKSGDHVLAAVSGGADSVALLCFLSAARETLGITVSCAHIEHGIRGQTSCEDMEFVRALCARKQIAFYCLRADVPALARQEGSGLEETARKVRHAFLRETAQKIGADAIALAHHAADQAETVLMHAARGADLRGLCAMRMKEAERIRPLLRTQPDELRSYLMSIGQTWREDETNAQTVYARNRIRHTVIPQIRQVYPGVIEALGRVAEAAQRDEEYFAQVTAQLPAPSRYAGAVSLDRDSIRQVHPAVATRMIAGAMRQGELPALSAEQMNRVLRMSAGDTAGRFDTEGGLRVQITARQVIIAGRVPIEETRFSMETKLTTPFGRFTMRPARTGETGDGVRTQVIPRALLTQARIGSRQTGDRMIPFGRTKETPLKKLFIDAGIPQILRDRVPILRTDEAILWAVGVRPSAWCTGGEILLTFHGALPPMMHNDPAAECRPIETTQHRTEYGFKQPESEENEHDEGSNEVGL